MIESFENKAVQILESAVHFLAPDEKDLRAYKATCESPEKDSQKMGEELEVLDPTNMERVKNLGFEMADISLYHGHRGLDYLFSLPLIQKTDSVVDFKSKKETIVQGYRTINNKVVIPFLKHVLVIYDAANNYITLLIEGVKDVTEEALEYIKNNYNTIKVYLTEQWIRFDVDKDGIVSMEDLKQNAISLYNFLKDFSYLEQAHNIKDSLYAQAKEYIKKDNSPKHSKKQVASDDGEDEDDDEEDEEFEADSLKDTKPANEASKERTSASTKSAETKKDEKVSAKGIKQS